MDDFDANASCSLRQTLTKRGIEADFESQLHMDVWQQNKALLNGVEVGVKLHQSSDKFRLFSQDDATASPPLIGHGYQVEITEAKLKVCYLTLNPSVVLAHTTRLKKSPALYPYYESNVKTFTIAQGDSAFSRDDIFHGVVPNKLIVGFVTSQAYSGAYNKNPFNFQNFGLNYLELAVGGRSVPGEPFQPKFMADPSQPGQYLSTGYSHEYQSLFKNKYPQEQGNSIQRSDFPRGYAVYVYDIKPGTDRELFSPLSRGHTRLSARFDLPTSEPIICIVYGLFPSSFKIDEARNILQ